MKNQCHLEVEKVLSMRLEKDRIDRTAFPPKGIEQMMGLELDKTSTSLKIAFVVKHPSKKIEEKV